MTDSLFCMEISGYVYLYGFFHVILFMMVDPLARKKKLLNQWMHFLVLFLPLVAFFLVIIKEEGPGNENMNTWNVTLSILLLLIPLGWFLMRRMCGLGLVPSPFG